MRRINLLYVTNSVMVETYVTHYLNLSTFIDISIVIYPELLVTSHTVSQMSMPELIG